jgi:hypothetical protein
MMRSSDGRYCLGQHFCLPVDKVVGIDKYLEERSPSAGNRPGVIGDFATCSSPT